MKNNAYLCGVENEELITIYLFDMKKNDFIQRIKSGEAQVLTVEKARQLKGKRIYWMYFGYKGQDEVGEMVVGDIVNKYDYYMSQPMEGWPSRSDYWNSYMKANALQEIKDTLMLLEADGKDPFIYAFPHTYDEPTFTCSDADREIYYLPCE